MNQENIEIQEFNVNFNTCDFTNLNPVDDTRYHNREEDQWNRFKTTMPGISLGIVIMSFTYIR